VNLIEFHPFTFEAGAYLALVVALLCFSALMSGSETSLFSLGQTQMEHLRRSGKPSDHAILKLLESPDRLLATVLIGNNLVNICIVILANNLIDLLATFHSQGWEFTVKTVVVTFILLLFGEIMPKIFAAYNPLRLARLAAPTILVIRPVFKPLTWLLLRSSGKIKSKKASISIDELSDAMEVTHNQSDEERQMLSGIVNFVNTEAGEVMQLRMDVVALDIEAGFAQVQQTIMESGLSRLPVYEGNIDTIKGILYVKDMVPFIGRGDDFAWHEHLRRAYFVPEHKKINDLLAEFQAEHIHLAIVVDEYGATQGLVSLEDILEEVVGDITDESDKAQPTFYERLNDNTYIFEGKAHIGDLEEVLGLEEDYFGEAGARCETVAGLVLELRRDFLKKGESVSSHGITFTVTALDGRRIDKVKVVVKR
jgi:gliding motility-associated protein GldE